MSTTLTEETTQELEEDENEGTVVETKSTSSGFVMFNVLFILAMIVLAYLVFTVRMNESY